MLEHKLSELQTCPLENLFSKENREEAHNLEAISSNWLKLSSQQQKNTNWIKSSKKSQKAGF